MCTAIDFFDAYLDALTSGGQAACDDYQRSREVWTHRASLALAQAGRIIQPATFSACRGEPDCYGRSEYLTLDVTVYDDTSWAPPLFVGEHENYAIPERVQYSAWKLLCVFSQRRMLIAYFGEKTAIPTFEKLVELVRAVCEANKCKDILLVGGDYNAYPQDVAELRSIHQTAIVGVHD